MVNTVSPAKNKTSAVDTDKPKVGSKLWQQFAWSLAAIAIVILGLEIVFDLANVGEEDFLKIDPLLGFTHLDNKTITFHTEGYSQSTINADGFRDQAYSLVKPANVYRIAVLGDSKTAGFEVPLKNTFAKVLEAKLNKAGLHKHVEVMNCGMSGYSTAQEYVLFLKKVLPYKPDMTILAYDYVDSDKNVSATQSTPRPFFSLENGKLTAHWQEVDALLKSEKAKFYANCDWLHRNSHILGVWYKTNLNLSNSKLYAFISNKLCAPISHSISVFWGNKPAPTEFADKDKLRSELALIQTDKPSEQKAIQKPAALNLNESTIWANEFRNYYIVGQEHWAITSEILRQFAAACQNSNSQFIVLGLPAPNNSIFYCRELQELSKLSNNNNFSFIDLNKYFPSLAVMEKSPYYTQVHFSAAGHALVADSIIKKIIEVAKLDKP